MNAPNGVEWSPSISVDQSKFLVESILDEVIQHPESLMCGPSVILGYVRNLRLFFGEGMQPSAEIEHLPVGFSAIEFGFQRIAIGLA